jgi:hypothetical protein
LQILPECCFDFVAIMAALVAVVMHLIGAAAAISSGALPPGMDMLELASAIVAIRMQLTLRS